MRMLRKTSGNTKKDMIQNKEICLKIGVIDEIMRETGSYLRWFGLVIFSGGRLMHQRERVS